MPVAHFLSTGVRLLPYHLNSHQIHILIRMGPIISMASASRSSSIVNVSDNLLVHNAVWCPWKCALWIGTPRRWLVA